MAPQQNITIAQGPTPSGLVYYGAGEPSFSAVKGSLYLRADASGAGTMLYTNTGGSSWTPDGEAAGASDTDAQAFLTAASITDGTITSAIDALVIDMKAADIWTKMKAVYPFVGGSSSTHKWNLKDPQDTDGAYRLSFAGSWTHDDNGITGDQLTTYADTHFVPSTGWSANNASLGIYNRLDTNQGPTPYDMGASAANDTDNVVVITRYTNNNSYYGFGTDSFPCNVANNNGQGFYVGTRDNTTSTKGYRNGLNVKTVNDTADYPAFSIYIGALNRAGEMFYPSNKNWAFAFIADALSADEVSGFYDIVQDFQTALGREV